MNRISATDLKNRVAEVLNTVMVTGTETIVERYGKPVVKITPFRKTKETKINLNRALINSFGSIPDFPEVTKFRKPRRKALTL